MNHNNFNSEYIDTSYLDDFAYVISKLIMNGQVTFIMTIKVYITIFIVDSHKMGVAFETTLISLTQDSVY